MRSNSLTVGTVWLGACLALARPPAAVAQDWVAPLIQLDGAGFALGDTRLPLAQRIEAARALGYLGPGDDAERLLLDALSSGDEPGLRDAVFLSLSMRRSETAVQAALTTIEEEAHPPATAFLVLAAVANATALDALVAFLGDEARRPLARWALHRIGPPALDALLRAQQADDPPLAQIAGAIGELGDPQGIPTLLEQLEASDDDAQRTAILQALRALTERAPSAPIPALGEAATSVLADPAAQDVHGAALRLLSTLGPDAETPGLVAMLARRVGDGPQALRSEALAALCATAPAAALPLAREAGQGQDLALKPWGLGCALDGARTSPTWIPWLGELLEGTLAERAASALARVPDGRGIPTLQRACAQLPKRAPLLARALAIAIRQHGPRLSEEARASALGTLRGLPDSPRLRLLRALAGDHTVADALVAGLAPSATADERHHSALGLGWLGPTAASPDAIVALCVAMRSPGSAELRRRSAEALRHLGGACARLPLRGPAAPELTLLLGAMIARGQATSSDARQAVRRALRPELTPDARTRSAAALALGMAGEPSAIAGLREALSDPSSRVRVAAARALRRIGGEAAMAVLRSRRQAELDALAFAAMEPARLAASELLATGRHVLEVHVGNGEMPNDNCYDVWLPDGQWRCQHPTTARELLMPDLPAGYADVTPP